jgi:hypothetical protein
VEGERKKPQKTLKGKTQHSKTGKERKEGKNNYSEHQSVFSAFMLSFYIHTGKAEKRVSRKVNYPEEKAKSAFG